MISPHSAQLNSCLFKKGHIQYQSFQKTAEYMPTPFLLTPKPTKLPLSPISPFMLASLQRWMLRAKVIFCWLTTQTLRYSRRLSLRKAVQCLVLRQGGLSQRCEVLMLMKTWLLFWPHFITGYSKDSPSTISPWICFSLCIYYYRLDTSKGFKSSHMLPTISLIFSICPRRSRSPMHSRALSCWSLEQAGRASHSDATLPKTSSSQTIAFIHRTLRIIQIIQK